MVHSQENWSDFKKQDVRIPPKSMHGPISNLKTYIDANQFKPKPLADRDIEIAIEACSVCGSGVHTLTGGWGRADPRSPSALDTKSSTKSLPSDRKPPRASKLEIDVGVCAQVWACLECTICESGNENYCPRQVGWYLPYLPSEQKATSTKATALLVPVGELLFSSNVPRETSTKQRIG